MPVNKRYTLAYSGRRHRHGSDRALWIQPRTYHTYSLRFLFHTSNSYPWITPPRMSSVYAVRQYTESMGYKIVPALGLDFLTPLYDFACSLIGYGKPLKQKILEASGFRYGESLLDVGCGTATLVMLAKSQHPTSRVVGIDPDEKILRIARRKIKNGYGLDIELIKSGAEQLPFGDGSFDVVINSLVFHHLPADIKRQALKEIHRVLNPTGRFLLADFGPSKSALSKILFALARISRLEEWNSLQDNIHGRIPILLKEAGFTFKETQPPYRGIWFWLAEKIQ